MVAAGEERGGIAVAIDGEIVVDVAGGAADPASGADWQPDTLACCFSVTKGVLSILAHRLIDKGVFELGMPVASYWPEFAQAGKADITVLDVLTHRAGLPAVSVPVRPGSLYDWDVMTGMLAASQPVVPPRGNPVYHNMTYGHLLGETMRRAASATSLTSLLTAELLGPLGADFALGMTSGQAERAARITQETGRQPLDGIDFGSDDLFQRSMRFFSADEDFNSPQWRAAAIGSGSGHGTAKSIALIFGQLVGRSSLLTPDRQLAARAEQASSDGCDPVMSIPIRYGQGLELSGPPWLDFGPNSTSVGHWGAGGAIGFADPSPRLSFGYVTASMAPGFGSSPRSRRLVEALYRCL
ncbi:serine hydrolase domain-containing protein [Mesorhizobium sp. CN2-181]|uniref:serine hydrolase domain-containing protein n=1 Tax=Mesorhizobium yinganensis TaxID=3157707 RepID=UPI0032B790FE